MAVTIKWSASVRSSGKLLLWANVTGSAWAVPLERAIKEFNRATHARNLKLTIEQTNRENDAQLTFGIGSKDQFESSTHGETSLAYDKIDRTIQGAEILVHPNPQVRSTRFKPGSRDYEEYSRDAGEGVRVAIIAHEFIHACGLENHSNAESQDIFYSPLVPNAGSRPQGDFMRVPINKGLKLPPVVISAQTASRLRDAWA